MLKQSLVAVSLMAAMITLDAHAFDFKGTTAAKMPITSSHGHVKMTTPGADGVARQRFKTVYLMKANISAKEKQAFSGFNPLLEKGAKTTVLPATADVGMNNVPVLDQGAHGACATFANTAAIDALLNKGDYISQLCTLELGSYLEARSDMSSGWDGSTGPDVLNLLTNFGIINTTKQKEGVCAGITAYTMNDEDNLGKPMSLDDYHAAREKLENVYWEPILSQTTRIFNKTDHGYKADDVLNTVKKALVTELSGRQSRITFGVMLPDVCFAGACAKYHVDYDTWALTDAINYDVSPKLDGHEMVITGYDDNATVTDNEGKTHQGVFILRNSWGAEVGDNGTFYMTYDFFKKFAFEVQQVVMVKKE